MPRRTRHIKDWRIIKWIHRCFYLKQEQRRNMLAHNLLEARSFINISFPLLMESTREATSARLNQNKTPADGTTALWRSRNGNDFSGRLPDGSTTCAGCLHARFCIQYHAEKNFFPPCIQQRFLSLHHTGSRTLIVGLLFLFFYLFLQNTKLAASLINWHMKK